MSFVSPRKLSELSQVKDNVSVNQNTVLTEIATDRYVDQPTTPPASHSKINSFLDSTLFSITLNIITLYALFGDDIKTLGFPKSSDDIFSSLVVFCLLLFLIELILSFLYKPGYRWSFYFWLDLVATLSLIPDIGWIWDEAIGISSSSNSGKSLQSAGKASRAGTKTTRALRIIRIVRLIRLVKLYKNAKAAMKKREKNEELGELFKNLPVTSESKVGKKMAEVVMKRVILIVLVLLFILPLFDTDFYFTKQTSWEFGLSELRAFLNEPGFEVAKNTYIDYHEDTIRPIVYLQYQNETGKYEWESSTPFSQLRYNEIYYSASEDFISIFDLRYDAKLTSGLNIFRTVFICIALALGSIYFSKDSEELIIKPIEKMIEKIKIIARNPIAASDIQHLTKQTEDAPINSKCRGFCCKPGPKIADYETNVLENTILKIGVLLALGFGEAGSLIIANNVEKGGEVDPMAEGSKVIAIYGFCDIRNFTDTTEELQEGVMMFVNEIAQVVHGIVDKYLGAANKNIGDAFLLVWKFADDEFFLDCDNVILRNPESLRSHYLPDLSLLSFLKIMAKVNKDPEMLKYRRNPKLLARMPGYEVKMGFGLHLGWSIEGAIGSQFKIDASYLSPNVNVASSLEGLTKMYGVPLLISETLYKFFSHSAQQHCRQIDRILIKGSSEPLNLYTSDVDLSRVLQGKPADRSKSYFRAKRKALKKGLESRGINTSEIFRSSKELRVMREPFSAEFFRTFERGLGCYLEGEWVKAKKYLKKTLKIKEKDGPALSLLSYISDFEYAAPSSWQGIRSHN